MKKYIVLAVLGVLVLVGLVKFLGASRSGVTASNTVSNIASNVGADASAPSPDETSAAPADAVLPSSTPPAARPQTPPLMTSTGNLFSDSPDYQSAYRIFPTPVSSAASQALDGFDMKTENLGNNIYRVTLTAIERSYHNQTFVVSGDQKVYFVEKSLGDDAPGRDYDYRDDYAVAVDAQGHILQ